MQTVYSITCPVCSEEHAFRDRTSLPDDEVCHRCHADFLPNGKIEYEEDCENCGYQNYYSQYVADPKCIRCGLRMSSADSTKAAPSPDEMAGSAVAGRKTGHSRTIMVFLAIIIAILFIVLI